MPEHQMPEQLEFNFSSIENQKCFSLKTSEELYSLLGIDSNFLNELINAKNWNESIKIVDFDYLKNPLEKLFLIIKEYLKTKEENIGLNISYWWENIYLNFENWELIKIKSNQSTYRKTKNWSLEWTAWKTSKENYWVAMSIKLVYEKINS